MRKTKPSRFPKYWQLDADDISESRKKNKKKPKPNQPLWCFALATFQCCPHCSGRTRLSASHKWVKKKCNWGMFLGHLTQVMRRGRVPTEDGHPLEPYKLSLSAAERLQPSLSWSSFRSQPRSAVTKPSLETLLAVANNSSDFQPKYKLCYYF